MYRVVIGSDFSYSHDHDISNYDILIGHKIFVMKECPTVGMLKL